MRETVCIAFLAVCVCARGAPAAATNSASSRAAVSPGPAKQEGASMTVEEARAQTGKVIDEWVKFFTIDFKAEIACPELMTLIQNELKKKSPIPVKVSHVYMVQTNGKSRIDFDVENLPPGFPSEMQAMASQAARASEAGRAVERLSPNLMKSAAQMLMSKEDFAIIKANEDVIRVEVNQVNEPFFKNRMIRTLRCEVDRKAQMLTGIEFVFTDNKRLGVTLKHTGYKVPGRDALVNMPSEATFVHDIGFAGLPPKFTVSYKEYTFLK